MAKYTVSVRTEGRIKEYMDKGPQARAHALLSIREQFLTKALVGKVLPGVGLVNPLFYGLGQQGGKFFRGATTLSKTEETSALEKEPKGVPKEFRRESFEAARPPMRSVTAAVSKSTPALIKAVPPYRVHPVVVHDGVSPKMSPDLQGEHEGLRKGSLSVLSSRSMNTSADTILLPPVPKATVGANVSHPSVSPMEKVTQPPEAMFSVKTRRAFEFFKGSALQFVDKDTAADAVSVPPGLPVYHPVATSVNAAADRQGTRLAKKPGDQKIFVAGEVSPFRRMGRLSRYKRGFFEEFIQRHRFVVFDATRDGYSVFEWRENDPIHSLAAGFASFDAPFLEIVTESVKEGTWEFPRQIPVSVTEGRLTFRKGVVFTETDFWVWIQQALRGNITRRKIMVQAYGMSTSKGVPVGYQPTSNLGICGEWTIFNCFPVRYQAGDGWDAASGDILTAEMEIAYEFFEESTPSWRDHVEKKQALLGPK